MDAAVFRSEFPVLARVAYLNAGTDGPVPMAAVRAAREALESQAVDGRYGPHFEARAALQSELRALCAELLGCTVEDVALTSSTSAGLGAVLAGLDLGPGDEIVTSDAEHPGLLGPLISARERGVTVTAVPLREVAGAVSPRTTLVACSHVSWITGEVAPAALADAGVPVVLDGAQGIGAVPVDVRALGCAAYAASGQKWLCGADGTGMLYLEPAFRDRLRATAPAYTNFEDASRGLDSPLHTDARRFDAPSIAREVTAFTVAAVRFLRAAGFDAVQARGRGLAGRLAEALAESGRAVAPRGDTTLVAWEDADPPATAARLAAGGVVVRHLPGRSLLRASVGAWNDDADLDRLFRGLTP
jgi:selenocysteine lyase/cysteine desulfurase